MKTLKMKGVDNHTHGLVIIDSARSILPNQNDEYRTIPGLDIKQHIPRELGHIELKVVFFRENQSVKEWYEARLAIAAWLYSKDEIRIEVDDEPGMYFIGKATVADVPTRYRPDVSFEVTFTLHPFRYGKKVDITMPRMPSTSRDESLVFRNDGTYETSGVITIEPDVTLVRPTFTINGGNLHYTENIRLGDVVTIDTEALEFRVNGVLKVREVTGRFTPFYPGNIIFQLSDRIERVTIRIEFTERFL